MKNKGFTLVELLAVIVILGIILGITTVSVLKIKEKQDEKNLENTISSILTAAKEYNAETRISSVSVSDLKSGGYVDYDENEYNFYGYVTKTACTDDLDASNDLKFRYVFSHDGTTYNDCGCKLNDEVTGTASDKICK